MPSRALALIAGSLFAVLLTCAPGRLSGAERRTEIAVLLRFDKPPAAAFITTMERELARIMEAADLTLHWLTPSNADGRQTFAQALIFTFHGECQATPVTQEAAASSVRLTLAETAADGTSILPYSELNCDRLRGFLAREGVFSAGSESRLGFATARVLAHEMYDVLLQTHAHGKTGITRAVHSPSALLSRSLRFNDEELDRLRNHFRPPSLLVQEKAAQEKAVHGKAVNKEARSKKPCIKTR